MAAKKTDKNTKTVKSVKDSSTPKVKKQNEAPNIGGRPPIWETPEELYADWQAFVEERKKGIKLEKHTKDGLPFTDYLPMPITIEGFCAWKNISRQGFYRYGDVENTPYAKKFSDTLSRIAFEHEDYTNVMAGTNQFNAQWWALYAKNKFGYSDKRTEESTVKADVNLAVSLEDKKLFDKIAGLNTEGEDDN